MADWRQICPSGSPAKRGKVPCRRRSAFSMACGVVNHVATVESAVVRRNWCKPQFVQRHGLGNHRLIVWCKVCRRQRELLGADIVAMGKGDAPLVNLKRRSVGRQSPGLAEPWGCSTTGRVSIPTFDALHGWRGGGWLVCWVAGRAWTIAGPFGGGLAGKVAHGGIFRDSVDWSA